MKKSSIKVGFSAGLILLLTSIGARGQYVEQYSISQANGNKMIEIKNYSEAVRQFSELLKKEPNNLEYQLKLGMAYNNSLVDKKKGYEVLQTLSENSIKPEGTDHEWAIANFKNYHFEEAIKLFTALKASTTDELKKAEYDQWIKQCKTSKKLYDNPISVSFENLGKYVNSAAPDFTPLCLPDESVVTFSTKRDGVNGNLYDYSGYRTSDIYMSKHKRNKYSRSRSIGSPNTYGNEFTAGRSENGKYFLYNVNSEQYYNDLFVSEMGKRSFMPPKVFDSKVVNAKSAETGATLSNDGKRMYFSSDREGGLGGFDIYMVQRLPNGQWGEPKNVGKPINTSKDEKFPFLMNEGQSLYFSSNGHEGMGGLDLFHSDMEEGKWGSPSNLGYPVNTVDDDYNISFAKNKRHAYVSAYREGGFGDLDIYRLTFLEEKEDYTLLLGSVMNADSTVIDQEISVEILNEDSEVEGIYKVNKWGKFSAALSPGLYTIEIGKVPGYKGFNKEIRLLGKNDFQATKEMYILLSPE